MRAPILISLALAFLCVLLPAGSAVGGNTPVKPSGPTVLPPSEEEHKKVMAALEKAQKEKDEKLLMACLIEMSGLPTTEGEARVALVHDDFKPHIEKALKSKDEEVKHLAILAAAYHELKEHEKTLTKLLKKKAKPGSSFTPDMAAAVITYVDRLDLDGYEDRIFEDHLEKYTLDTTRMARESTVHAMRAGLHYLGRKKYKPCVKWLIGQIKKPEPENPNSPSNPPASYWKARYELWQATESWIRWTLLEITGQKFRSEREWKAWYARNEKEYESK